jgi:flagellar motor component MotA
MRIVGYILALALIVLAIGPHVTAHVTAFIDIPSLVLVLGFMIWGFLAAAGAETGTALRAALSGGEKEVQDLQIGLHALRTARHAALAGGFVAAGAGLITMLKNVEDPATIGPGMALMLLGLFFAVFFAYVVLLPLQVGIERRLIPSQGAAASPSETPLDLMVLGSGFIVTLITFTVLLVSIKSGS